MSDWKSVLRADSTDWLLETENPSVRYFALSQILDKPQNDPEMASAKEAIMRDGVVPEILAKQNSDGSWDLPEKFYTAKYKGTVWQLLILAELGADQKDEQIRKACEFILENSQDRESGGFSAWPSVKLGGGRHSGVIPCLTGNMVSSLIKLGLLDDERIQCGVDWIVRYQRFDDSESCAPKVWPYEKTPGCFGKHSCHMGVVKSLKALSEIPTAKRSKGVAETIEKGAEYMLKHNVHKRSHNLSQVSKPGWLRFGFPLMYQTDVLEVLGILTKLDYRDERMQEAIDVVVSKQNEKGQWNLENTFNPSFQTNIEQKNKPSKWITLNALTVLKRFYS
ncbi:MAG: nitrogen fixation protein NifH [Candidatus Bathyarchaeia archaeon]